MSKTKNKFKPTKTYEEYIEILKYACEELGRSITPSELEKHKFELPNAKWLVNNSNQNITNYNDLLESLGFKPIKKHNPHRKYTYEIAQEEFAKRGLILLPQEYKSCAIPLEYICPKHPNIVQGKSLNSLLFGNYGNGTGCNYCYREGQFGLDSHLWKGGISSLSGYLRECIDEWKKDSMANCDYKCVITGKKFIDIHHLYSFNKIIKELFEEINLPINLEINKYTENELELIKETNIKIHNKYPLGVCLCREIHDLYHNLYGDDNTPEQFEEFRLRYNSGEFNKSNKIKKKTNSNNYNPNKYRKFSVEQANEIREKYNTGNYRQKDLAKEYSTSPTYINNVINFRRIYANDKLINNI